MADKELKPTGVGQTLVNRASINFTKLFDAFQKKHSAFSKSQKGEIFVSITEWINPEGKEDFTTQPNTSMQLNSTQEMQGREPKIYIGNGRTSVMGGGAGAPITDEDANKYIFDDGDIETRGAKQASDSDDDEAQPDDLPF